MNRRLEALFGIAALALGLAGLGFALFGPVYSVAGERVEVRSDGTVVRTSFRGPSERLIDRGLPSRARVYLGVMVAAMVGAVMGGVAHARFRVWPAFALLWASAVVLFLGALVAGFSIGLFFMPAAGAALLAAVCGLGS